MDALAVFPVPSFQQKEIEELRWKNDEQQHELRRLQLLVKEKETEIEHRQQQNAELTENLEDMRSRYTVTQQRVAALRVEKEELEEVLGTRHSE